MSAQEFALLLARLGEEAGDVVAPAEVARRCYELEPETGLARDLGLAVWVLLNARSRGSTCIDLGRWGGRELDSQCRLPEPGAWRQQLLESAMVVEAPDEGPHEPRLASALLVVDRSDRLYLRRDYRTEGAVATELAARIAGGTPSDLGEELSVADRVLALVRGSRLTLICGGPGTGKTTAVRELVRALLAEDPELRIALAAPTGKAAARMAESLGEDHPLPVLTLHRLLGLRPGVIDDDPPRLPYDLVLVDEASMVGMDLMHELLRRLDADARLVLMGDARQLSSVDAGAVLADLHSLAGSDGAPPQLRSSLVEFQQNWRFDEQPGISALAGAIRSGDGEAAIASLRGDSRDLVHHELHSGLQEVVAGAVVAWQSATESDDPERAAQVLRETRVLCALREGPFGVGGVTRRIEARLRAVGVEVDARSGFYPGRPILISENAPELDLANGDVGVLWLEGGHRVAFFDDRLGGLRRVAMAQLPAFLDAWAMTVHKSQGSEFDEVWLVLPPEDHPLATRDLVYTAVTRARRRLHVVGSESALLSCVEREEPRASGLASRLASRLAAGTDGLSS